MIDYKENNTWIILKDIIEKEGIARQHLNSYNEFVPEGIQNIINEFNDLEIEALGSPYKVKFGKVIIKSPRVVEIDGSVSNVLPVEARLRNLTYTSPIYLEMSIIENGEIKETQNHYIGDLPVMVKSTLCPLQRLNEEDLIRHGEDPAESGGYFIVNGSERVIVGLEDLASNKILVDIEKSGNFLQYKSKIYSSIVGYRAKLELTLKRDGAIYIKIPTSPVELPFVIIMRALGFESDKQIAEAVSLIQEIQDHLDVSFDKASDIITPESALIYIGNRIAYGMLDEFRIKRAESLLDWGLLPHLGRSKDDRTNKAIFLGEAACKLFELKLDWIDIDDKDHYGNKVIKFAGEMLADIFRTAFRNMLRDMKYQLEKMGQKRGINAVGASIRPGIITDKLRNSIATGNWGRGKVGVTQLLDRTNYLSNLSHLRRIQSPLSRSQPNYEARDLHGTHFGRICPNETPEGSNCGLVKNLALSAIISVSVSISDIIDKLSELGMKSVIEASDEIKKVGCKIFLEGSFKGYVEKGNSFVVAFRKLRRQGIIDPNIGIYLYTPKSKKGTERIYISTHSGRVLRPLIVLENGKSLLKNSHLDKIRNREYSWRDLLKEGILELIDANEEENCFIAINESSITKNHTHLELPPAAIFGVAASMIPYPEHNQSPRNTYGSAMAKQSLGFPSPTFQHSTYVRNHMSIYPQQPLVSTNPSFLIQLNKRPLGQNCIVAVMSYEGYNIEDAIVMNKSSVERGLARTFFYRLYEAEAKQYLGGMKDEFTIPSPESNTRGYRGEKYYRLLESDGAVMNEANVIGGDVIIGRTSPPRFIEEYREFEIKGPYRRDTSISVRPSESGVIDSVFLTESVDGGKMFKVRVRDQRIPEIGDKFASRHGQKGVIGLLAPQEDMPYTENGIVPDIIINPHAFPSRMTVGQFIESITGKAACLKGSLVDGTSFTGEKTDDVKNYLIESGFHPLGLEVMYDGKTGKKFEMEIFIGVVYYQKLHHMVSDKIHARARGQVQMLTKQPTEGRARGGGLRFGEMERDCLIAYGASMVLKDRLLDEADRAELHICEKCGLIAYYDTKQRKYICRVCGESAEISTIIVAYAFKLLLQEMMSLNIVPKLILKGKV